MAASTRSMSPSPVPSLRIQSLPPSRSSSPVPITPTHPQFYMDDEMAVFLVEGCLFRIHRFFLDRESKVFPRVSGLENAPGVIELGPEVTRFEFESLLDFIYNGMHTKYTPSLPEWTALLSISTRFEMTDIRNRAIPEIDKVRSTIEPVEQVMLAVTHNVLGWLPDAYTALCLRDAPITLREMKQIGDETMVLVAEAREAILKAKFESKDLPQEPPRSISSSGAFGFAEPAPCNAFGFGNLTVTNSSEPAFATKQEPVLPLSSESVARRIVDEVFWRKERERERLENEKKLRRTNEEKELKKLANEKKLREIRDAKEKAARQLLELEEALGGHRNSGSEGLKVPETQAPLLTSKKGGKKSGKNKEKGT